MFNHHKEIALAVGLLALTCVPAWSAEVEDVNFAPSAMTTSPDQVSLKISADVSAQPAAASPVAIGKPTSTQVHVAPRPRNSRSVVAFQPTPTRPSLILGARY